MDKQTEKEKMPKPRNLMTASKMIKPEGEE
jgi:hypothetical protein